MSVLDVDTDALSSAAAGVAHVAAQLSDIRAGAAVTALGGQLGGGAVEAAAGGAGVEWSRAVNAMIADVALAGHSYEQSVAMYDAVERHLAARAVAMGRQFLRMVTGAAS